MSPPRIRRPRTSDDRQATNVPDQTGSVRSVCPALGRGWMSVPKDEFDRTLASDQSADHIDSRRCTEFERRRNGLGNADTCA